MSEYKVGGHVEAAQDGPGTRSRLSAELVRLQKDEAGWELHSFLPLILEGRTDEYIVVLKRDLPITARGEAASEGRTAKP